MPTFNPFLTDNVEDISIRMLMERLEEQQLNKLSYLDTMDDFYNNANADDDKRSKYFPQPDTMDDLTYQGSIYVSNPLARIFVDQAVHWYGAKDPTYSWEGDEKLADEANELTMQFQQANNYEKQRRSLLTMALRHGEVLDMPKYWRGSLTTGKEFKFTDSGVGCVKWLAIPQYWYDKLYFQDYPDIPKALIISWLFEDGVMKPIVNRELDTEQTTITQLISTDAFNVETLEQIEKGIWKVFKDEDETPIKDSHNGLNPYGVLPGVFWQGPDVGDDGIYPESFIQKGIRMFQQHNEAFTAYANALKYVGFPQFVIQGEKKPSAEEIVLGPQMAAFVGENGDMKILSPDIKEGPFKVLIENYERMLEHVFSIPMQVIAGEVMAKSGIQLKLLFGAIIKLLKSMEMNIDASEKDRMKKEMLIYETANNFKGKFTDKLRPVIEYKDDIIPSDEEVQLNMDVLKKAQRLLKQEQLLVKYNPAVETKEEAEEFIKENTDIPTLEDDVKSESDKLEEELDGNTRTE